MPPAAIVEYAEARSSGVTTRDPRPIDGTYAPSLVRRSVCTPRLFAMRATFSGPTSSVSLAYTVLSECSVPLSIDVAPRYEWSYVSGHHAVGGSVSQEPVSDGSYLNGAERYCVDGLMPCAIAVVSTIVLKVEPGCRRADDAKLTWFFGLPGLTSVIARIAPVCGS